MPQGLKQLIITDSDSDSNYWRDGHGGQVEGSDVTWWVNGAVRIQKPWKSQAGGADRSQRSQSGRWNRQRGNQDLNQPQEDWLVSNTGLAFTSSRVGASRGALKRCDTQHIFLSCGINLLSVSFQFSSVLKILCWGIRWHLITQKDAPRHLQQKIWECIFNKLYNYSRFYNIFGYQMFKITC